MKEQMALEIITNFYLTSDDFNGIPMSTLRDVLDIDNPELIDILIHLISDQKISIAFGNVCSNPHIKQLSDIPLEQQIEKLETEGVQRDCIYPSKAVIEKAVDIDKYNDRPFAKRLLLGEPQLQHVFFELSVLERYFSDPRYRFVFYDYWGKISISSESYKSGNIDKKDEIFLQTFGLGYDEKDRRIVVVFLRYLNDLSPEHQQIWNTYAISRNCKIVDHYYESSILGKWPDHISIYSAFLKEQVIINELVNMIGKEPFFRTTYKEDHLKEFSFFLKPTLKNYHSFIHLLDKLISDNINKNFFKSDIELEKKINRGNDGFEIQQKGTLSLLEEWLNTVLVKPVKQQEILEIISPLKEVRALRQKPAHSIDNDIYDDKYNRLQQELISKVYNSIRMLRLLFAKHPKAKSYNKVPKLLLEGKIRNY